LVDGEAVVFAPGGSNVTMVALNKNSGDLIWKTTVPNAGQASYASTVVMEVGGVKQYVQSLQNGLIGVDAKSGKFLWRYDRFAKGSPANIPTPVVKGNYVYGAGARTGAALLKVDGSGDSFTATEVYFDAKLPAAIGGFVLVGNELYGALANKLMCVDFMTGAIKWEERSNAPASVLFADGNLYLHGEDGSMVLAAADAAGYKEKGRFTPAEIPARPNNGKAWAYPVLADGKLLVRDGTSLWCYNVKGADVR
jgi:outer membrane protein assembly factor BamB